MENIKEKHKNNQFRLEFGCLRIFFLGLMFCCAILWATLWLFAHFGGEWASSSAIPIPPNSEPLNVSYEGGSLTIIKTTIYENPSRPEELREWFIQTGILMTPLNEEDINLVENYYNLPSALVSEIQEYHYFASIITHNWWDDVMPMCQTVRIYKEISLAIADYPNLNFSGEATVIVITNCWAAN